MNSESERLLGELLAIIHRDGGHHQSDVGTEQAIKDAIEVYYKLIKENDEMWEDSKFLNCLKAAGVDNWSGYSDAWELMKEDE